VDPNRASPLVRAKISRSAAERAGERLQAWRKGAASSAASIFVKVRA
jgi:hypothetical protein